jgi:hypothetical protein
MARSSRRKRGTYVRIRPYTVVVVHRERDIDQTRYISVTTRAKNRAAFISTNLNLHDHRRHRLSSHMPGVYNV